MTEGTQQTSSDNSTVRAFHVGFPEAELSELRRRVTATRWPELETVTDLEGLLEYSVIPNFKALAPRVRGLKVAPGTDPEAEMGPLVTRQHYEKVKSYIDLGVAEGVPAQGLALDLELLDPAGELVAPRLHGRLLRVGCAGNGTLLSWPGCPRCPTSSVSASRVVGGCVPAR